MKENLVEGGEETVQRARVILVCAALALVILLLGALFAPAEAQDVLTEVVTEVRS